MKLKIGEMKAKEIVLKSKLVKNIFKKVNLYDSFIFTYYVIFFWNIICNKID